MTRHLLVIGAQRCGTTYLHTLLDAHPDITMARPSRPEPKAFLSPDSVERGLESYRAEYFAHAGRERLLGEKSTSYIEHPDAAGRAAAVLGTPEIVVLLRDPVARAVSNWQFSTASGLEDRPLQQALTDNLDGARAWDAQSTSVSPFAYLERGRYADYLDPWYASFPDTMHVLFFAELVGDEGAVADLYAALGVDRGFVPAQVREGVNQSEGTAPDLDAELVDRLRDYFAGSDKALRERLGRALPWDVT